MRIAKPLMLLRARRALQDGIFFPVTPKVNNLAFDADGCVGASCCSKSNNCLLACALPRANVKPSAVACFATRIF